MRYWIIFFWFLINLNSHLLYARESGIITSSHDQTSIITESDYYDKQGKITLGLRIRLKPGWHTYWINPGDAGEPASVQVKVNEDARDQRVQIDWPVPERLSENGLVSYVYQGEAVLPFHLSIPEQDRSGNLNLVIKASWLVCSNVCVPEQGIFSVNLPAGVVKEAKEAKLIQKALAQRPVQVDGKFRITPAGKLWIDRSDFPFQQVEKAWFMPEENGILDAGKKQVVSFHEKRFELYLPLLHSLTEKQGLKGILAVQGQHKTSYWSLQPVVQDMPAREQDMHFFLFLGSAFWGGFLLNFMPCVFPVLAMKLLSLSHMKNQAPIYRYKSGLLYAAGILCCFSGIAAVFVILRWMGEQIGWGTQFQSLSFLIVLCWLLLLIALNFLNVFTINLSFGYSRHNVGTSGLADFFTGMLAVLVATPCTAPFMGMAVAAALHMALTASILIFLCMGLGLAFPYLFLTFVPVLTRFLPKAGLWMEILRQFLAFPLLLSCVWLVWVIYQHQNSVAFLLVLSGSVGTGLVAWLLGVVQQMHLMGKYRVFQYGAWFFMGFIVVILGTGLVYAGRFQKQSVVAVKSRTVPFSFETLNQLRMQHKAVFVNMTAGWCLTCLVNDRVALSSDKVKNYFKDQHIVYMIGDWTDRNNEINRFLRQFGREGIPLYVYYPPDGQPLLLPQLLTSGIVLQQIESKRK